MLILLIDFRKSFEQNRWIQSNCAAYFAKLTPAFEKRNYFQTRSSFSTALRNILLMKTGACCCYKRLFKGPWTLQWYFRVCVNYSWESEKKFSSRLLSHFHATPRTQQHRSVDENCLCVLYVYHNFCNSLWCFFSQKWRNWNTQKTMQYKIKSIKKFLPWRSRTLSSFAANIVFWFDYISLLFKAASLRHIAALFQAHIQLIWPLFLTLWCKFGQQ